MLQASGKASDLRATSIKHPQNSINAKILNDRRTTRNQKQETRNQKHHLKASGIRLQDPSKHNHRK